MTDDQNSLCDYALSVLNTPNARDKAIITRQYAQNWRDKRITKLGEIKTIPDLPARPDKPVLMRPWDMPKHRKSNSDQNRIKLLHALSHIELNAIDLAWDIIARFAFYYKAKEGFSLPIGFYDDWLKVADDEAKHFLILAERLSDFDTEYGDMPAHDGLWDSAEKTAHDFAARLAIVPMVLEARGLDVTPHMIDLMKSRNDFETAALLKIIHDDEITHVQAGTVWFKKWCEYHNLDQEDHFQELVRTYFHTTLKKPFNHPSRQEAGMIREWYEPLAEEIKEDE